MVVHQQFFLENIKINNVEISKEEAILMASAIMSDTLLLKSPTTMNMIKKALEELEKIAGIDIKEYGLEMLKGRTDLNDFTAKRIDIFRC